jgi:hypothetical protein
VARALVPGVRSIAPIRFGDRQHVDDSARVDCERKTFFRDDLGLDA